MGKRKHSEVDDSLTELQAANDDSHTIDERIKKKKKKFAKENDVNVENVETKREKKKVLSPEEESPKSPREKKSQKSKDADASVMIVNTPTPKKGKKRKADDSVVMVEDATPKIEKKKKKEKSSVEEKEVNDTGKDVKKKKKKKGKNASSAEEVDDTMDTSQSDDEQKQDNKSAGKKNEFVNRTEKLIGNVLDYLHQWRNDVHNWKFNKYYQSCLINYVNDPSIINEEDFMTCIDYLKKCRGFAKEKLKIKSRAILEKGEEAKKKRKSVDGPEKRKDDDCTLFVKNLPYQPTKEELIDGLKRIFPKVLDIRIPHKKNTINIGFAFMTFSKASEVSAALSNKQGVFLHGRPLKLDAGRNNPMRRRVTQTLDPDFVAAERQRRATQILDTFK